MVGTEAEMNAALGWLASTVGSTVGALSGNFGGLGNIVSSRFNNELQFDYGRKIVNEEYKRNVDTVDALTQMESSEIAKQLHMTKPAYACDKYYPSNGVGTTNFTVVSFCDIIALCVKLQPNILDVYDKYFTFYGYSSGRCGIPRLINYISGSNDPDELPHWGTISGNRQITYVKTMDMKVSYSMLNVASYIKAMFDNGVRMIKGD